MRQPQAVNSAAVIEVRVTPTITQERQQQAEGRGRLDPARVLAALVVGGVLGDVDRRAAVLAAEGEALEPGAGVTRMIGARMPICA